MVCFFNPTALPAVGPTTGLGPGGDPKAAMRRNDEASLSQRPVRGRAEGPLQRRKPAGEGAAQDGQGRVVARAAARLRGAPGADARARATPGARLRAAG